ncbi:unnamed protein product [Clavelina lepadiformis]|uniref:non-specific serine/threonine protein kinase n=1 Tax=Clavelina lepadiformis TaxID=159417 RepID=A0ABP0G066_CLALP
MRMSSFDAHSQFFIDDGKPIAFSTPANKLNKSRPLPIFADFDENKLFRFKGNKPQSDHALHPKSPIKSAPPVSRVFPHRNWAPEKPHAVSFRACDDHSVDSALCSRFYNSECSELYFEQCFIIEKKLGEGSFGEVMQVRCLDNKLQYAVKRSREKFKGEADRRRKLDEVKKHEKLPPHPNCVRFIKAWEEKQRLYIQTELCMMSLQEYLEKNHFLPIHFVWKYLIDLLLGLQHIHRHGCIHFDVKPANIFITEDGTCKIGDFGLVIDRFADNIEDAREGDNKYMAPELLNGVFSEKADVFSLGIAILEVTCDLDLPSSGMSWHLLRQGCIPAECLKKMPFSLRQIVQWMMTPEHTERPTILKRSSSRNRMHSVPSSSHLVKVEVKEWDSSISSGHLNTSFNDSSESSAKAHLILTPDVHNHSYSRFTPTPRNSSPVASRQGNGARHSPDISPLSRNRPKSYKDGSTSMMSLRVVDDFNCFVSDHSDEENSDNEERNERFLSSKPRNLLDMLNEVSDSDHSRETHDITN